LPGIGSFLDGLSTFVTITAHDLKQVSIRFPILVSPNGSAEMFSPERGQSAEFTNLHFCSAVAVLSAVKGRLGAKSWPWLTQLPQLGVKIADFSAKTKKVFTTSASSYFLPPASLW